jgi:ATP synthase protein I
MIQGIGPMDKASKKALVQFAYASSLGIAMVIAIFGSLYLGFYLDRRLGTGPVLTLLFLAIGIAAVFRNIYTLATKYFADEEPVIKCIKSEPHRKRPPAKKA